MPIWDEIEKKYVPENFLNLEYQSEAAKDAKNKFEEYGDVFISDVAGLGKTHILAMLAGQLDGRNLSRCLLADRGVAFRIFLPMGAFIFIIGTAVPWALSAAL